MVYYANLANQDKLRYQKEMRFYNRKMKEKEEEETMIASMELALQEYTAESLVLVNAPFGLSSGPTIADLAQKLDKESIDFIVQAFKWSRAQLISEECNTAQIQTFTSKLGHGIRSPPLFKRFTKKYLTKKKELT